MMHKNTGAPFSRADGSTWGRDEEHEATLLELKRRAYKLRAVVQMVAPRLQPKREDGWPLDIEPARYLELSPEGPHAGLARQLVEPVSPTAEDSGTEETDDGATDK